jgi:PKD repeat protein
LTINALFAGDLAPNGTMVFTAPTDESLTVNLAGTATDDIGVASVRVSLQDRDTGRYLQANGTMAAAVAYREASLNPANATSTAWSLPAITLPTGGDWRFTAIAYDTRGQQDPSAASAGYAVYPNDGAPSLSDSLGQPRDGSTFSDGKIVVTGRAEDAADANASIASVRVAVKNSLGQYMGSSGTFTSTSPSWRTAFLNSPGSAGSNYSYTTPVIPAGTYSVEVQAVDVRDQLSDNDPTTDGDQPRIATGVVVSQPSNNPPVASFTYSCTNNVCAFDGRGSTDENPTSLTYAWNFGGQGSTSGPVPTKTFTAPGTFAVTLTVTDEWKATSTSAAQNVTIVEPPGNSAPVPTFVQSCQGLTCSVNSQGTADPNSGDTISYSWNWGDGTALSTGASPGTHVYAAAGSYTITLTTTDGWGNTASTTRTVSLVEPAGNRAPTASATAACATFTVCVANSSGSVDPDGDTLRYVWSWGDGTPDSTSANPSHTYAKPGSYTVRLTVTDAWGKAAQPVTIEVTTPAEPAGNVGPTVVMSEPMCTGLVCRVNSAGTMDDNGIMSYTFTWGDGTADTVTTSTRDQSHTYATAGTYTVTLVAADAWGRTSQVQRQVTVG